MVQIAWNLLGPPADPAAAVQRGYQQGREIKRQQATESALAAFAQDPTDERPVSALMAYDPRLGLQLRDQQRQEQSRAALGRVFQPPSALSAYAQPTPSSEQPLSAISPADVTNGQTLLANTTPGAPTQLVDPGQLPPRTDGLRINQDALRELYSLDPQAAVQVQRMIYDADARQFEQIQRNGATMAQMAWHLSQLRGADGSEDLEARRRELEQMAPMLQQFGVEPAQAASLDLTDVGLRRYQVMGRSMSDVTSDDRAERKLAWDFEDARIDNARDDDRVAISRASAASADRARREASTRGWRADRRAETRLRNGQGADLDDLTDAQLLENLGL